MPIFKRLQAGEKRTITKFTWLPLWTDECVFWLARVRLEQRAVYYPSWREFPATDPPLWKQGRVLWVTETVERI